MRKRWGLFSFWAFPQLLPLVPHSVYWWLPHWHLPLQKIHFWKAKQTGLSFKMDTAEVLSTSKPSSRFMFSLLSCFISSLILSSAVLVIDPFTGLSWPTLSETDCRCWSSLEGIITLRSTNSSTLFFISDNIFSILSVLSTKSRLRSMTEGSRTWKFDVSVAHPHGDKLLVDLSGHPPVELDPPV